MRLLMDDLALAAHLAGDAGYAARLQEQGLKPTSFTIIPPLLRCNPEAGLRPEDRVVLDVALDGFLEIHQATPVWASRPGPMADMLARRALDAALPEADRRGLAVMALDLASDRAADGAIGNVRVLLSQPALLFDQATDATMPRNRPAPATGDGRAIACTGQVSRFRWQLAQAQ